MSLAGCGSVVLHGTFSTVTFRLSNWTRPFTDFPTATFGTGSLYFVNDAGGSERSRDGINGLAVVNTEPVNVGDDTLLVVTADLQRVSFRLPATGSLGDRVWSDTNSDGVQDGGEPGVAGVTVTLTDATGANVLNSAGNPITTTTDATGAYSFTNLELGDYRVRFTLPSGQTFTTQDAPLGTEASDSDADPTTGLSSRIASLTVDAPSATDLDAGLVTPQPSIRLVKSITDVNDTNGSGFTDAGDTITYGFTVTNTGGTALSNVGVTDSITTVTGGPISLAIGASDSTSFTSTYVITAADVLAGGVENTALASGTAPDLTVVTDVSDTGTTPDAVPLTVTDPAGTETPSPLGVNPNTPDPGDDPTTLPIGPQPSIRLVKSITNIDDTNGSGFTDAGDTVTYGFAVTNTGNTPLSGVTVTDSITTVTGGPISLAIGATDSTSFTSTYVITQADVDAGGVENTALASGTAPDLTVVTDVSDTGTTPDAVPQTVTDPAGTETPSPLGVNPNTTDPGDDPTTLPITPQASIRLVKSVTGVVDTTGDGIIGAGDTVSYGFTVTNTGIVTLAPVTITDAKLGLTAAACAATLAPGATVTCSTTGSYVFTQADVNAGAVENTALATGTPPVALGLADVTDVSDTGTTPAANPAPITTPEAVETANPLNENPNTADLGDDPTTVLIQPVAQVVLVKSATVVDDTTGDGVIGAGDTVTYGFVVTNTGNVTLAPVVIDDAKLGLSAAACATSLAPGASATCTTTGSYEFTQADVNAGGVENTATATGTPVDGAGDPYVPLGSTTPLADVTDISDTGSTPTAAPAPIINPAGQNTPNPLAVNPNSTDNGDDPTTVLIQAVASVSLVKSATSVTDTTGDGLIGAGDTISYSFTVTNNGNVTLAPVTIDDTVLGLTGAACVATLAPGATATCSTTGTHVITQADVNAGGVENSATATGVPPVASGLPDATDISDTGTTPATAPAAVVSPATTETPNPLGDFPNTTDLADDPTTVLIDPVARIVLVKSITDVADTNGSGPVDAGDTVTYGFVVTNTGNVTLAPVTIDDAKLGLAAAACVASLAPGATATCSTTGSYVLTQADVDAGGVENTATATGTPVDGAGASIVPVGSTTPLADVTDVSDTGTTPSTLPADILDPAGTETDNPLTVNPNDGADPGDDPTTLLITPEPSILLVKSATNVDDTNGSGRSDAGDTVTYEFVVTNTGNVTLAPVTIDDAKLGLTAAACVASLAPGATATCSTTGSYIFTQTDVDAGGVENTATATGTPPAVTGLADVTDVSDTGSTPTVVPAPIAAPANENTTNPLGVYTNTASFGDDPTTVLVTPVAEVVLVKPITDVADTTGDGLIGAGDTVTYGFVVTNTGNVTLAPLVLNDSTLGLVDAACVATLAPNATATCSTTGSYVLTQDDVDAGGVENTAVVRGTPPAASGLADVTDISDTGTTPADVPAVIAAPAAEDTPNPLATFPNTTAMGDDPTTLLVVPVPRIELVKSISDVADTNGSGRTDAGDTISYEFVVTNTGNTILAPVTIDDATLGLTDAACVATLAPGASATCSTIGSYVLTAADVDAGGVENTALATGVPVDGAGDPFVPVGSTTPLAPVTDVSDTGTTPEAVPLPVTDPAGSETPNPLGVFGNDPGNSGDDPTTLLTPAIAGIELVKSVTAVTDTTGDGLIGAGDTITYGFVVTNTGNVTLAPVTIDDAKLGLTGAACVASLASGATATCSTTGSYVVTQADVDAGAVENTATATGTPPAASGLAPVVDTSDTGTTPEAAPVPVPSPGTTETPNPLAENPNTTDLGDDPTTVLLSPVAHIVLVKSITDVADTNGSGRVDAGDTVTYEFTVTNTGNVTLAPVTIDDGMLALTGAACVSTLAPGATATCSTTGSYVLTQADVDAGGVENTALATGTPADEAGNPLVPLGAIDPLAPVTDISDTGTTPEAAPQPVLDPAGSETGNPLDVFPNNGADPGDDPTTLLTPPIATIELIKSVTSVVDTTGDGLIGAGDTVTYDFVVTNTGNVTLAPVTISDATLGLTDAACAPSLAAGATVTCSTTGSYVFTQADVDAGGVENTATATGTPPALTGLAPVSDVSDTGGRAGDGPLADDHRDPEPARRVPEHDGPR